MIVLFNYLHITDNIPEEDIEHLLPFELLHTVYSGILEWHWFFFICNMRSLGRFGGNSYLVILEYAFFKSYTEM